MPVLVEKPLALDAARAAELDCLAQRRGVTLSVAMNLREHAGVHPRLGVVDVVPFVALPGSTEADALAARDRYGEWSADTLGVPCFRYGPERTLPDVRRGAFRALRPDDGPAEPHPSAGACAVGARPVLVAYNLWLGGDVSVARRVPSSTAVETATGPAGVVRASEPGPTRSAKALTGSSPSPKARISRTRVASASMENTSTASSTWGLSTSTCISAFIRRYCHTCCVGPTVNQAGRGWNTLSGTIVEHR